MQLVMWTSSLQQGLFTYRGSASAQMMVAEPSDYRTRRTTLKCFLRKTSGATSRQPLMWYVPEEFLNAGTGIPLSSLPMKIKFEQRSI